MLQASSNMLVRKEAIFLLMLEISSFKVSSILDLRDTEREHSSTLD